MGSVVPILGIITQTKFRVDPTSYRNVLGAVNANLNAGINRQPAHIPLVNIGHVNTMPAQNANTGGGSSNNPPPTTQPVINPDPDTDLGGYYTGGGYMSNGNSIPDPPPYYTTEPTNGIPTGATDQYQALGTDAYGCSYYGIDQNGNIITDPKMLPCYMEKIIGTPAPSAPSIGGGTASTKKSYATFNTIGLVLIAGAVGVAIYKRSSKSKTKTN